jgi:hypothetical protein
MSCCIWQWIYMGERVNPLVIFLTIDHLPDKELNFGVFQRTLHEKGNPVYNNFYSNHNF